MSLRAQRGNPVAASTNAVASFRLSPNVIATAARQSSSHIDQRGRQLPIVPQCHCDRSAAISQPHPPTPSPAFDCPPMSLRPQRGNLAAASTNAAASFRLSSNVIASAARQSRSRIDQRRRQLSIVPQCHCERSAAISQRHRPTRSPAFDCPPMSLRAQRGNLAAASTNAVASFRLSSNVIASAARQSRSSIDQRRRQLSIAPNVIATAAWQSRSRIDQRRRQIPVCLQMSLRAQRGNLVTASTKISDTRPFHHRVASQYPVSSQAIRMAKRALVSPLPDPSSRIRQRVSGSTANFVGICNAVACPSPFNSPDRSAQHGGCHHRPMPRHPSLT